MNTLNDLTLLHLFKYINTPKDYHNLLLVNKHINNLIKNNRYILYNKHFPLSIEFSKNDKTLNTFNTYLYTNRDDYIRLDGDFDKLKFILNHIKIVYYTISNIKLLNMIKNDDMNNIFKFRFINYLYVIHFDLSFLNYKLERFNSNGILINSENKKNIYIKNVELKHSTLNKNNYLNNIKLILNDVKVDCLHLNLLYSKYIRNKSYVLITNDLKNQIIDILKAKNVKIICSICTSINDNFITFPFYVLNLVLNVDNWSNKNNYILLSKNLYLKNRFLGNIDDKTLVLPNIFSLHIHSYYNLNIKNTSIKMLKYKIYHNIDRKIKYLMNFIYKNPSISFLEIKLTDINDFYSVLIKLYKYYKKIKYLYKKGLINYQFNIRTLKIYCKYRMENTYLIDLLRKTRIYKYLILDEYFNKYDFIFYKNRIINDQFLILFN